MQKRCNKTGRFSPIELTTGSKHNKWTVIGFSHKNKVGNIFWQCECECGTVKSVAAHAVISGKSKSCGCNRRRKGQNKTHGLRNHPLYKTWMAMKYRCLTVTAHNYHLYGGRGISICDRWLESVVNFYNDMFNGYQKGLHLDRIDVNGNYCPENCRWVTGTENNNNKRVNWKVSFDGRTHTPTEWGSELGIKANTIQSRKRKGWTDYEALFGLR